MNVEPLSEAELNALDAHMSATESAMSLTEARGYLTAVASAPTLVRPGDWLQSVLGEGGFADLKDANRIFDLLTRLYNDIITKLDAGRRVAPGPDTTDEEVTAWCTGYLRLAQSDSRRRERLAFATCSGDSHSHDIRHADGERPVLGHLDGNVVNRHESLQRTSVALQVHRRRSCRVRTRRSMCSNAARAPRRSRCRVAIARAAPRRRRSIG